MFCILIEFLLIVMIKFAVGVKIESCLWIWNENSMDILWNMISDFILFAEKNNSKFHIC